MKAEGLSKNYFTPDGLRKSLYHAPTTEYTFPNAGRLVAFQEKLFKK